MRFTTQEDQDLWDEVKSRSKESLFKDFLAIALENVDVEGDMIIQAWLKKDGRKFEQPESFEGKKDLLEFGVPPNEIVKAKK